ncbi:MAG: glycosyltransferase [Caldisericum sp.]
MQSYEMNTERIANEELVAFFIPSLAGGGGEKFTLNLIRGFISRNIRVELIVNSFSGPFVNAIPKDCKVVDLKSNHFFISLFRLLKYIVRQKPYALVSSLNHANTISLIAKIVAFWSRTKLIIVTHTNSSYAIKGARSFKSKLMPVFMFLTYWVADYVVGVSQGVTDDIKKSVPYLGSKLRTIYNPVISSDIFEKAKEPVDHPWFISKEHPVILGVGRLTKEKDFPTLLKAFALVRKEVDARLVILGEGKERQNLEKLAKELGISEYVWMPGFVDNPYKYMSKASVFVLSSLYEGLSMVLIESLALGIPVVSTDCPSGPREVLEDGKYGKLVPVGDYGEIARAINEALKERKIEDIDLQKYTFEYSTSEYVNVIFGKEVKK